MLGNIYIRLYCIDWTWN